MSCDRRCFDPTDKLYEHDDCTTCPGADRGPRVVLMPFLRLDEPKLPKQSERPVHGGYPDPQP